MQYSRVYQSVLSLLQDETFGTTGSELVAPGAFRMMCYCIISCDNLGRRFSAPRSSTVLFSMSAASSMPTSATSLRGWVIAPCCARAGRKWRRRCLRTVHVASLFWLVVWAADGAEAGGFHRRHARAGGEIRGLFGCPLYFNQTNDLLYFDSACLAWPVVHTEHSLREFLRTAPYQLLMMENGPTAITCRHR